MLRRALAFLAAAGLTLGAAAWPPIDSAPRGALDGRAWGGTTRYDPWRLAAVDPLLSGLVYFLPATESGGDTVYDAGPNGHNGTLAGGATVGGGYVSLGGTAPANEVQMPAGTTCAGATALTLSVEVYIPSSLSAAVMGYFEDNGTPAYARFAILIGTDRVPYVLIRDENGAVSAKQCTASTAVALTTWTRITATVDTAADEIKVRVGGTTTTCSQAIATFPPTASTSAAAFGDRRDNGEISRGNWLGRGFGKWSLALPGDMLDTLHAGGWTP